jgi:hypothetical protein
MSQPVETRREHVSYTLIVEPLARMMAKSRLATKPRRIRFPASLDWLPRSSRSLILANTR